jgi:hypothetical protein
MAYACPREEKARGSSSIVGVPHNVEAVEKENHHL